MRLRPREPRFLPPNAIINLMNDAADVITKLPVLQPGQMATVRYIPRGEAEPADWPAIVIFEHDGKVTLALPEIIDGIIRARHARISRDRVRERFERDPSDHATRALLKTHKDYRAMIKVKEAAISEKLASEHYRKRIRPGGCRHPIKIGDRPPIPPKKTKVLTRIKSGTQTPERINRTASPPGFPSGVRSASS